MLRAQGAGASAASWSAIRASSWSSPGRPTRGSSSGRGSSVAVVIPVSAMELEHSSVAQLAQEFKISGFCVLKQVIRPQAIEAIRRAWEPIRDRDIERQGEVPGRGRHRYNVQVSSGSGSGPAPVRQRSLQPTCRCR